MESAEFVEELEKFEERLKKLRDSNTKELNALHWDFYTLKQAVYRKVKGLPEPKPKVQVVTFSDMFPDLANWGRFIKSMFTGVYHHNGK